MTITKEQLSELEEAAHPLMEWMIQNCHPHCKVIVESDGAELVESVARGIYHEVDPTLYCNACGAKTQSQCDCPPTAANE